MKYTLTINQNRSVEWELTVSEAIVFSWLYELPSWAEKLILEDKTYYFGSRNVACKELPIISDKADTIYRLYKSLEKKGLILMVILQKKDYIAITEKGKNWHYDNELPNNGKKSEETRNEIRENSEINPTYKYTNNNQEINNQLYIDEENNFVERMYGMYPTKCPCRNVSLGKCSKDKDRIRKLLKTYSMEQIESVIKNEVETKYGKSWMQNFSTFLNNFPDPNCLSNPNEVSSQNQSDELIINGVKYQ